MHAQLLAELIARATNFPQIFLVKKNPSPERIAAWRGLLTVQARVVARIEDGLAAASLPPLGWYDVLFALHEQPDKRLRMAALAEEVLLSRSGLTRLVDRLEAQGYLQREPCPTDKRGFLVVLTGSGTELLRKIWPVYRAGIAGYFSDLLSDADITNLSAVFGKILRPPS